MKLSPARIPLLFLGLLCALPSSLPGQEEVIPWLDGIAKVGTQPLGEGTVLLHRVSAESSGEIDSVRVAADGTFRLRLPFVPDHATRPEVFFASIRHQGLLYFGPAITEAVQLDSLYVVQAYDTVSVPEGGAELPVSSRSLFLEQTEGGWAATDLIQIRQEGERTLFSPEEGVIWSYPLPPTARDFQPGQADMGPEEVRFRDGRMEVYTPIPPGERYFLVRYSLPGTEFSLPLQGETDLVEVLVREPGPPAEFPPLTPTEPVELEPGNVYRRYMASNLRETVIEASVAPEPWHFPAEWLGVILAGLLGGAGVYAYRRRGASPEPATQGTGPTREQLLLAVAELDEAFSATGDESPEAEERYRERREALLRQLKGLS